VRRRAVCPGGRASGPAAAAAKLAERKKDAKKQTFPTVQITKANAEVMCAKYDMNTNMNTKK
jgi:hypothetical protein